MPQRLALSQLYKERENMKDRNIFRSLTIRGLVKLASIMQKEMEISFQKEQSLHLPLLVIRIVERQHCLTSLQVLTSMLVISRVLLLIVKVVLLRDILTLLLQTFQEYILCLHTAARRLFQEILC